MQQFFQKKRLPDAASLFFCLVGSVGRPDAQADQPRSETGQRRCGNEKGHTRTSFGNVDNDSVAHRDVNCKM